MPVFQLPPIKLLGYLQGLTPCKNQASNALSRTTLSAKSWITHYEQRQLRMAIAFF